MLQGLEELNRNLKLVGVFTEAALVQGMEKSLNLIVTDAKNNHKAASGLTREQLKEHPDPEFYTHSAKLVNSIKAEKVQPKINGIEGKATASEKYAAKVELGGPNSRAFPFLGPALNDNAPAIIVILGEAVKQVIK